MTTEELIREMRRLAMGNYDVDETMDVLLEAADRLEEKKTGWIDVKDRLPEEHETIFARFKGTDKWTSAMFEKMSDDVRVAVTFKDGTRMVRHGHTRDGKWDIEPKYPECTVTHWMPNPELPWEEENETV